MDNAGALPLGHRDTRQPGHLVGRTAAPRTPAGSRECSATSGTILVCGTIDSSGLGYLKQQDAKNIYVLWQNF